MTATDASRTQAPASAPAPASHGNVPLFADRVLRYVPPRAGMKQMNQLLHASFNRFPELVESRYDDAFMYLNTHCKKRSLVVLVAFGLLVPAVGLAADGQPKKALTKKDQARATSIVIKRSDLGQGFTAVARDKDTSLPKGARCDALDESDLTVTGDAASPDFRFAQATAFVTIGSTAQVYRTLREANASWKRGTTRQTTTCLADIVRLSAAPGEKITVHSATRMRFPSISPKKSLTMGISAASARVSMPSESASAAAKSFSMSNRTLRNGCPAASSRPGRFTPQG